MYASEMAAAAAAFRVVRAAPQLVGVGTGAHDRDVARAAAARA